MLVAADDDDRVARARPVLSLLRLACRELARCLFVGVAMVKMRQHKTTTFHTEGAYLNFLFLFFFVCSIFRGCLYCSCVICLLLCLLVLLLFFLA